MDTQEQATVEQTKPRKAWEKLKKFQTKNQAWLMYGFWATLFVISCIREAPGTPLWIQVSVIVFFSSILGLCVILTILRKK